MKLLSCIFPCFVLACVLSDFEANAGGVTFTFTESSGRVFMNASGTLDTSNLVTAPNRPTWGGVGIESGGGQNSNIMGDAIVSVPRSTQDTWLQFSEGTDVSPWYGDMFTLSRYFWTSTGTTEFGTYHQTDNGVNYPGLIVSSADLNGTLWTPDNRWEISGTFESLGMTPGDYTITDAATNEFISIQIVPEPGTAIALSITGLLVILRRNSPRRMAVAGWQGQRLGGAPERLTLD